MVERGFALTSNFACKLPEISARFDEPVGKSSFAPRAWARSRQTATYPFRLDRNLARQTNPKTAAPTSASVRIAARDQPSASWRVPARIAAAKPAPQTKITPRAKSRMSTGLMPAIVQRSAVKLQLAQSPDSEVRKSLRHLEAPVGRLNLVPGGTIDRQRCIMADANALISTTVFVGTTDTAEPAAGSGQS